MVSCQLIKVRLPTLFLALFLLMESAVANGASLSSSLDCPEGFDPEVCQLQSVVNVLRARHVDPIDVSGFLNETIRLGVRTLPYASFRTAKEQIDWLAEQDRTRNGAIGLGLNIEVADDLFVVVDTVPLGPAATAGLQPGDRLMAVDGKSLRGVLLQDVSKLTRGAAGTDVVVEFRRGNSTASMSTTLTRGLVRTQAVATQRLGEGVLYARLSSFPETVIGDFVAQVSAQRKKKAVKAVILDLRRNGGGAVNAAVGIVAAFVGRGKPVLGSQGRAAEPGNGRVLTSSWPDYMLPVMKGVDPLASLDNWWREVPLVVVVDRQTASAAEATAAALQDLGRAKLLGLPTYGKGLAQIGTDISDGTYLTWTSARALRPQGCTMEGWGVMPDWIVLPREGANIRALLLLRTEIDRESSKWSRVPTESAANLLNQIRENRQRGREERDDKTTPLAPDVASSQLLAKEFAGPADLQIREALHVLAEEPVRAVSLSPEMTQWLPPIGKCRAL